MESTLRAPTPTRFGSIVPVERETEACGARPNLFELADASLMRPSVGAVWLASAGLVAWSMFASSTPRQFAALAILTVIAAGCWSVRLWLTQKIRTDVSVVVDALSAVGVVALAVAAVASDTILSPFVLLLPIVVAAVSVSARWRHLSTVGLAVALTGIAAVAFRGTVWQGETAASAISYLGTVALITVASSLVGGRLRLDGTPVATGARTRDERMTLTDEHRTALMAAEDPVELARTAVNMLEETGSPSYVAIVEQIHGTTILRPIVERGTLDIDADALRSGLATLTHESLADGKSRRLINDGKDLNSVVCRRLGVDALLIVPLRRLGTGLGAIHVAWRQLDSPDQVAASRELAEGVVDWIVPDLAVATIAGEIERGYVSALATVSAALDRRELHTEGHCNRVARLALEIAELVGISDHEQRQLVYAAEMHDLGRVSVSPEILAKPAALTDDEWSQVKMIPMVGADIVEPVSFYSDVGTAIRHMRERWDGRGYPSGHSGSNIPMLSRILAVAEAYDAMRSSRPYRQRMTEPEALRQLWLERGKAFDPEVVEAFVTARSPRSATLA